MLTIFWRACDHNYFLIWGDAVVMRGCADRNVENKPEEAVSNPIHVAILC